MLRFLLLALGLGMSFMTVSRGASMSRSYNNDSSASPVESQRPPMEDGARPHGPDRSGYIVASS